MDWVDTFTINGETYNPDDFPYCKSSILISRVSGFQADVNLTFEPKSHGTWVNVNLEDNKVSWHYMESTPAQGGIYHLSDFDVEGWSGGVAVTAPSTAKCMMLNLPDYGRNFEFPTPTAADSLENSACLVNFELDFSGTFDMEFGGDITFAYDGPFITTYTGHGSGLVGLKAGDLVRIGLAWPNSGGTTTMSIEDDHVSIASVERTSWVNSLKLDGTELLPTTPVSTVLSAPADSPSSSLWLNLTVYSGSGHLTVDGQTVKSWSGSGYGDEIAIAKLHRVSATFAHGPGGGTLHLSGCTSYLRVNGQGWGDLNPPGEGSQERGLIVWPDSIVIYSPEGRETAWTSLYLHDAGEDPLNVTLTPEGVDTEFVEWFLVNLRGGISDEGEGTPIEISLDPEEGYILAMELRRGEIDDGFIRISYGSGGSILIPLHWTNDFEEYREYLLALFAGGWNRGFGE